MYLTKNIKTVDYYLVIYIHRVLIIIYIVHPFINARVFISTRRKCTAATVYEDWTHTCTGMQIHICPVARGDKNYVRAIVNQQVTSPAGDWFPVRSADHVWLFTHNCRAPHSMYRRRRRGALQSVVSTHTWLCVSETFTFEEHRSAHNSIFGTLKGEQLNQV